ncbi:MAG: L,D-transpeptidase [Verrucomicrobiota bacterium]|nr:L,D-transpeptidase [Verrucomicrobiota bacterium]
MGRVHAQGADPLRAAQGKSDVHFGEKAPAKFDLPLDDSKPALIGYAFSQDDQKFIGAVPESHAAQAKQESLPYESFLELVAEKFHCRGDYLEEINPGYDWSKAKPGDSVQVPNVAAPFDVQKAIDLKEKTDKAEKENTLTTEHKKRKEEEFSISGSVPEKILELKQNGKVVESYPITPGSKSLPAPIGEWFFKASAGCRPFVGTKPSCMGPSGVTISTSSRPARTIRWAFFGWS